MILGLHRFLRRNRAFLAGLGALSAVVIATVVGALLAPAISGPDPLAGPARVVEGIHNDTRTPFTMVSMPALMAHEYDVDPFHFTGTSSPGPGYVRHAIRYRSGDLHLTGTLLLPNRRPDAGVPLIVAVHGWRPPGDYVRGSGLVREENALARAGFAVLHPDLRNHAGSTVEDGGAVVTDPVGYPADVIAAVLSVQEARPRGIDLDRIGLLGRSMGGGAALQAAVSRPGLFDAVNLYSPISSLAADNLSRFAHWAPGLPDAVASVYGTPESDPGLWRDASARTFVDRLTMPVRIDHGTEDLVTVPEWSRATVEAMRDHGVDADLVLWPGEGHRFRDAWPSYSDELLDFFDTTLR